ncbi:chorein VPS13 like involved in vacuolar transport [Cryptosporidium sp. chipmunk genotype I]|uniref:chorein VPS13 like involved in vacuolar transport n=1 Tax=Cryptosporidium sp. chipmunk genotype I TaxID=1280935 RepID=UPI00351A58FF|nr:chorein VPS13 like involved in vacuolar transport [Cryptosporidium sp. chipmunk genotype I]
MLRYCSKITERVLYSTIKNVMNKIFTNFEQEQLSISLLGGSLEIRDLNIRKELFDDLSFPISLSDGIVGKVNIDIMWRKIFTQEFVKITLDDVYVIFNTTDMKRWSVEMFEKNWKRVKANLLKHDEFITFLKSAIASNFLRQIGHFFISKIQFEIKNINFRIEHLLSQYMKRFVIGISIDNISSRNCNEYWIPVDKSKGSILGRNTDKTNSPVLATTSVDNTDTRNSKVSGSSNSHTSSQSISARFDLDDQDETWIGYIVEKHIRLMDPKLKTAKSLVGGFSEDRDYCDKKEQEAILESILAKSKSRINGNKISVTHNFWSKLKKKTPLSWVWNSQAYNRKAESSENTNSEETQQDPADKGLSTAIWSNSDLIFPHPNGMGVNREIIDSFITAKESREIEKYIKEKLVQPDILEKNEIFLKSFLIENFSVYFDEISLYDKTKNSPWTNLKKSESRITDRLSFLKDTSVKEYDTHNFIIYPHKIELRVRLVPCIIRYDENIYASALNDRFYILSQDEDNQIIPLISSYLIFDNLSIDITENQLKLILDFLDYTVFLYGDFSAGSCPKDFQNFPGEEFCIKYRTAWFEFLIGERDRNNSEICNIEESYNAYSLIKLRNDVYKCLNYSIYHSVKSILSFDLDKSEGGNVLSFPLFSIKEQGESGSGDSLGGFSSKNKPVLVSETDKISNNLAQYIISKVVIGQNDHYSISLNMNEDSQKGGKKTNFNTEIQEMEIQLSKEEIGLVKDNDLLGRIKAKTRNLLSQNELPFEVVTFDLNSYLRTEKDEKRKKSHHTSPFTLILNAQNLTVNYSISLSDHNSSSKSRKSLKFNCLDLYLQHKLFTESKKLEMTVAAENCYMVVHDDKEIGMNLINSSNCLLRIGPNIQNSKASDKEAFEELTNHPILHRSSIYTGTTICSRKPYRLFTGNQGSTKIYEPCDRIGGFWITIRLNRNPFRTTPKVNVYGKTYGEISIVGSYDVFERFLDPIVNHLSPKQRNNYLNKANQNFVKVIRKGQKFMKEFFNNGGVFSSFSDMPCPNYIYLNIEAKAKQLLFFPILKRDSHHELLEKSGQSAILTASSLGPNSIKSAVDIFSNMMEYKINKLSSNSSMYCIDCGEMLIETFEKNTNRKVDNSRDKFFIDNIKISFSNISLSFMRQVRLVDLYINKDLEIKDKGTGDGFQDPCERLQDCSVRCILKPQNWTFSVSKHRGNSIIINTNSSIRQFLVNLEFSLKLAEDTSVEINTTDMDLHNIAEIANYFVSFYSQYNFIDYSQVLVSNVEDTESLKGGEGLRGGAASNNQSCSISSLESMESIIAHSISKDTNVQFLKNIEFICTIPDTRIVIKSDHVYRERQGMAIKDLPVIKLNVSSIKVLILNGDMTRSGVYVSIADVCLSGGILNRNSRLLVPLFCPISDTFCNLSIKFSDLSNIDRYKDFTGILLNNSNMDIQINNPRFIVYWDLYGIILNWIITFYFRSIAVHLERKIDIDKIKPILDGSNNEGIHNQSQSDHEQESSLDKNSERVLVTENQCIRSQIIQFLSIINLKIQFKDVIAILPCTLSDPIQVVITETESSSSSTSAASSSAASSASGQTQTNSGTGFSGTGTSTIPATSAFKVDILKSLLAVIRCDLIYRFNGESIFEIETMKNSHSRLKSNTLKNTFELFKGSIQFGRSLTPRYIMEALGRISRSHNMGGKHALVTSGIGVSKLSSGGVSNYTNLTQNKSENTSIGGKNTSILTSHSNGNISNTNHGSGAVMVGGGHFQKAIGDSNFTNLVKSFYLPGTDHALKSLVEIENLINSYQWQFNFDIGSRDEKKVVSSLRFKLDYIMNQLEVESEIGNVIMLYGFLETVEIKMNTNELLHLINVVDMYYKLIQSNLFVDLSNQNGQLGGGINNQDIILDMQSDYGSSKYNVGYSCQANNNSMGNNSSMMNYLVYLFPSIFHTTVTNYNKFISQFKLEGLKIHYIPTNLTSNKDGVLIDVTETQFGVYVNDEAPNNDFLLKIFPFLTVFSEGSKRLMDEFEIKDKLLLIPKFSISSIPILPILTKSKDIFFGLILEFKKISVSIFNNQLMFYDNILEPFDISLLSICKGNDANSQKISKEKVSPKAEIEITWINLTMTPEYVKYWLNCLDNFNEVYTNYYLRLNNTNKLLSRRVFPYNNSLGILFQCVESKAMDEGNDIEDKLKGISSRPLSGEWDDHVFNFNNSNSSKQITGGIGGNLSSSNFVLYNDTGQILAVLIPLFLDDSKKNKNVETIERRNSVDIQMGQFKVLEQQDQNRVAKAPGNFINSMKKRGNSNLIRRRTERLSSEKSIKESIFDKLLVRKKSVLDTSNLYSQESEMSNISNISKTTYKLYYVWRYLKPNHKISFSKDEYGNSYPIVVRIRILNDVFDLNNITMDKVNMEVVYLGLSERNQARVPLLIKTDIMNNHSFLISISSRVFISNNTSNIIRLLPNPKNVEDFLSYNFFIPPASNKPILVSKYNSKFYETISRKYIDKNYILSIIDEEISKNNYNSSDYINVLIQSKLFCKSLNPDFFTLYLNPNTYTCMPMWTSIPVLHASGKHEMLKFIPLRAVINNVWLESVLKDKEERKNRVSIKVPTEGEAEVKGDQETLKNEFTVDIEELMSEYLSIYNNLSTSSEQIVQNKCYKKLLTTNTAGKKKNYFGSSTIQLTRKLRSGDLSFEVLENSVGGSVNAGNGGGRRSSSSSVSCNGNSNTGEIGVVSICSSVCEYSQKDIRSSPNSFMFVIKLDVPLIIENNLLIPVQLSFNKEREKHGKINSSIEQIPNDRDEANNNERTSNSGSITGQTANSSDRIGSVLEIAKTNNSREYEEGSEGDGISELIDRVMYMNDSSRFNINLKNNERILLESLPNSLSLSILDVSFGKFFGFYKSSQIQINYNSTRKELNKEILVPLKLNNGYKLMPNNDIAKINGMSAVVTNGFLPSSTCINVIFESNRTDYVSKDFIPRQKQDFNYYMDNAPGLDFTTYIRTYQEYQTNNTSEISTPWNGYYCNAYNTCKVRLSVYASFWINNRQHIPIYVLQKSQLFSRYRLGSKEFRILPTNNGKSDLGIALNPELSKKFQSPFVHIERANIVGTITVPSKKLNPVSHTVGNNLNSSLSNQNVNIRDIMSGGNFGLKLGYCVTTINNFSKSPNFMINIYNKYIIVNYHNLPIWIRESNKFGSWVYIPPNISIPFHPLDSKDLSIIEVTFLDPKIIEEYEKKYQINLNNIPYKTLPLSIDNLYDIQVRLVSSLNNIPLISSHNQKEQDNFPNKIGNLHFTYILSSISIYSINSSTSYQINIYPSQIPDFSIVNETPCNIFIKQLNTSCWNYFSPISDSNYALLDPFGDHMLELVVGVSLGNLDFTKIPKKNAILNGKKDHTNLGYHNRNHQHRDSMAFNDFSSIPLYLYNDHSIHFWYKNKNNLNLNKVLTHSRIFIPEYNSMLYVVMLIENGTRVINISFDNTLYKRRRNEIRAVNQSNLANKSIRLKPDSLHTRMDREEDSGHNLGQIKANNSNIDLDIGLEGDYDQDLVLNHSGKSIFKTLGNKLKNPKRFRNKDDRLNNYDDDYIDDEESNKNDENKEDKDGETGQNFFNNKSAIVEAEISPEVKNLTSFETIKDGEANTDQGLNKITAVSSFETELSQFSNSNLSRVSSGQNLFLFVDKLRPETRICFELNIGCDGFGVSFLSNTNKEITYMSFQRISFKLENSKTNYDQFHMRFRIMEFQLDNHITSSAENTIIRKATPNEFLRLSKLSNKKKEPRNDPKSKSTHYIPPTKPVEGNENCIVNKVNDDLDDEINEIEEDSYYGIESLLSVGVATLGEVIKKKSEIIRIHNKLLEYMTVGNHENVYLTSREKRIKGILCMESFLDLQFSIIIDNNNDISNKYGSNGVIEIPYLYFWIYPLSIHLDIDTLREMVSILEQLINRILSPTEELDNTKSISLQSLPLVENLKKASKYVYIQVLLMNPIQILCSTSKSTWNISTNQNSNFTDYYNIMNNITKMGESEVIVREIIPLVQSFGVGGADLKNLLNFKIMNNFGNPYLNFNNELTLNYASIMERISMGRLGYKEDFRNLENGKLKNDAANIILPNTVSVNAGVSENEGRKATMIRAEAGVAVGRLGDSTNIAKNHVGQGQIQNNLTMNKTGTEFLLNILQWLSSMPFSNVPIEFKGVINESIFLDSEKCLVQIGDLYRQQIFSHLGKIIGSIDLIGNPIDIYILVKEGLLASKYHFDLYKRATKLKEKIQENIRRKRIQKNEQLIEGISGNENKDFDVNSIKKCEKNIEMVENKSLESLMDIGFYDDNDDLSSENVTYQTEKEKLDVQYQYLLDFCYELDEKQTAKTYDEEVDDFLKQNKSLVLRSNAELMTKLLFFSIKEIMVGLHILVGTGIAVVSQVIVRISSAILHLFEVTYLLDQDCLMSIWYGTPLFMSRYIADNPNNLIEGLITGLLRSLLIIMSILINFWQVPKKMYRQIGSWGIFLGVFLAILRIIPAGFASFLTLFYGISSGVVQSLRTRIPVSHIRTVRVICNGSPILPYNPQHSIATMIIDSLKLVNDVKESNVMNFISFKNQTSGSSSIDSNIDNIILNNKRSVAKSGIEKKFLIYKLLDNKEDSSLNYYNGIIIFKESISLLKSGKLVWMVPLINISRINLYLVVNNANNKSEDNNLRLNRRKIKDMFYSKDKGKNRKNTAFENLLDIESHFLGINKKDEDESGNDKNNSNTIGYNINSENVSGTSDGITFNRRSFEFHLFIKPWSYLDDLIENSSSQNSKSCLSRVRGGGAFGGSSRLFSGNNNTSSAGFLSGINNNNNKIGFSGKSMRNGASFLSQSTNIMTKFNKWRAQRMRKKGINLFSDKKFMKQLLLPKKIENIHINRRFTMNERSFMNFKTNNKALNDLIIPMDDNRTVINFNLSNNSFISFPSIQTSSLSPLSLINFGQKSSSISNDSQFQLSSCKQFSEKIIFTVEDKDDAIKVFSVLSKYINSE